jgi:hypothetical protein
MRTPLGGRDRRRDACAEIPEGIGSQAAPSISVRW